jgi:hypothetical protein
VTALATWTWTTVATHTRSSILLPRARAVSDSGSSVTTHDWSTDGQDLLEPGVVREEIRSDPSPVGLVDTASTAHHKHGGERRRRIRHPGERYVLLARRRPWRPGSSAVSWQPRTRRPATQPSSVHGSQQPRPPLPSHRLSRISHG